MPLSFPLLETDRLILRPPQMEDQPAWAAFMQDEEAARYIGGVQAPAASFRGLASIAGCWAIQGFGMFSMIEKASGAWIGRAGPWSPFGWPGAEIGWGVIPARQRQGFALEVARASMDFAVDTLGWTDIIHVIDPANIASQAVARRLGAVNRGPGQLPAPFESHPVEIWGQTAAQWKAGGQAGVTIRSSRKL
jgi:RimJ/RimL family protein N-acetyltransferase